jgi:hypothetical protein
MNELVYSSKKRVEKVIFSNGKSIELLEDYNYNYGGVVVGIYDNKSVKKDYTDMGFTEKEMMFENLSEEEVDIGEVFCKLDLKDSSGGYSVFYDKDMNELLEL